MITLFKCSHPFNRLGVKKEHTVEIMDVEFNKVTYHLFCRKCGADLPLSHAKLVGGVEAFLTKEGK